MKANRKRCHQITGLAGACAVALTLVFGLAKSSSALELVHIEPGRFFSQTVVVKHAGVRTIYISGQVGQGDGLEAQLDSAFGRLSAQLKAAGAGAEDLARIRIYVPNFKSADYPLIVRARAKLFAGASGAPNFPASTLLGVQGLARDRFLCEIHAIAVMKEPGSDVDFQKTHHDRANGFSQAVVIRSGGVKTVYVSGQVGEGADIATQAKSVYQKISGRLKSVGATTRDIVKVNTYIANYKPADITVLGPATAGLFDERKYPANTLIGIHSLALDRFKIEVDATAVLADEGSDVEVEKEYLSPAGGFTQVVAVTAGGVKTLYISGQVGKVTSDQAEQSKQAYERLKSRIESAGAKPSDLVMQNIYMANYKQEDWQVLSAATTTGLLSKTNNPTATLIGVNSLYSPQALIEVEAIAVTKASAE